MGSDNATELSEAIAAVRQGLADAQQDGEGSPIRFNVKEVSLELGLELRATGSGSAGVKAFVVTAGAKGERSTTSTHRMTVTLEVEGNPQIGSPRRGLGQRPDAREAD